MSDVAALPQRFLLSFLPSPNIPKNSFRENLKKSLDDRSNLQYRSDTFTFWT